MNTFYIARHGETLNNRDGRLSGWIDTPLTDNGLVPTQKVIEKLRTVPIDEIISSDLGRAFVTAYHISRELGFTKEIVRSAGLREVSYGDAANMKRDDAYSLFPGLDVDIHVRPPNGETLDEMQARILSTLNQLDATHQDKTILIVAHSGVMAAINASFRGDHFGQHNISEAYDHDYVAQFGVNAGSIASFTPVS